MTALATATTYTVCVDGVATSTTPDPLRALGRAHRLLDEQPDADVTVMVERDASDALATLVGEIVAECAVIGKRLGELAALGGGTAQSIGLHNLGRAFFDALPGAAQHFPASDRPEFWSKSTSAFKAFTNEPPVSAEQPAPRRSVSVS